MPSRRNNGNSEKSEDLLENCDKLPASEDMSDKALPAPAGEPSAVRR